LSLAAGAAAATLLLDTQASAQNTDVWNGGAGNWGIAANWSLGYVPNSFTGTISAAIDGGNAVSSLVTVDNNFYISDLTVDSGDALNFLTGVSLTLLGNGTINGAINLFKDPGGYGFVYFQGTANQTLSGAGSILTGTSGGNAGVLNNSVSGGKLTIGPGFLVHGTGFIRDNSQSSGGVLNQGNIVADIANQTFEINGYTFTNGAGANLIATNGGTLLLDADSWHNAGTFTAFNGTVNLGGAFTSADLGTFVRGGSSAVRLTNSHNGILKNTGNVLDLGTTTGTLIMYGGTIQGGTVTASGGAVLQISGNAGTLDGVTLATSPQFLGYGSYFNVVNGLTLSNNATIDLTGGASGAPGQYASIYFGGSNNQTLGGTGSVLMGTSNANSALYNYSGTNSLLTIGPGVVIHGTGSVHDNSATDGGILNQGTIMADVPGQTLTFDGPGITNAAGANLIATNRGILTIGNLSFGWHNAGTITAYNGTVNLSGTFIASDVGTFVRGGTSVVNLTGTLKNTGTTLNLNSNTGSWVMQSGGTILGGTVAASGGSVLQVNSGTLDGVTLAANVPLFTYNSNLYIYDGLTLSNGSAVDLSGGPSGLPGQYGYIQFLGTNSQTISGNGSILLGTNGLASALYNLQGASAKVTFGPGVLVHGVGYIHDNANTDGGISNQGTIAADFAGQTLTIDGYSFTNAAGATLLATNGGILNLIASSWHNAGTITAFNGTVNLGGAFTTADTLGFSRGGSSIVNLTGTLNNSGATLALNANTGSWALRGGSIIGGTVTSSSGALFQISGQPGTLDGVTLAATNPQFLDANDYFIVKNGLTLVNSTIDLSGGTNGAPSQYGTIYFQGTNSQTLGGTGVVLLSTNSAYSAVYGDGGPGAKLTIGPGILIHGTGYVRDNSAATGGIVNQGSITADIPGQILYIYGPRFTNAAGATLLATNGAILDIQPDSWHNAGTIIAFNGTVNLGGVFANADLGTFVRGGSSAVNLTSDRGGTLVNTGATLTLNDGTGSWDLAGGTLRGGTVTSTGLNHLLVDNGVLDGVTFDATTVLFNKNSSYVSIFNGLTLANGATIDMANGSNGFYSTSLYFTGSNAQSFAGNGQVTIGSNAIGQSYLYNQATTNVLSIGPGILIHGKYGTLQSYTAGDGGFLLQGTVSADVAGGSFNLNNFTNAGTLQAINGDPMHLAGYWHNAGTVNAGANSLVDLGGYFVTADIGSVIRGPSSTVTLTGNLTNTGSVLALNGTTGSWVLTSPGVIHGGTITTTGGAQLIAGSSGTLDGVTLDAASVGTLANGANLYITNGITLNNNAVIDTSGGGGTNTSIGNLYISAGAGGSPGVAGSGGQINFGSNFTFSYIYNYNSSNTLTIGPNILIHGKYGIFASYFGTDGGIVNQGTLSSDIAGGIFQISAAFTNTGTVQGINGAGLSLNTPRFVQTAGALRSSLDVLNNGLLIISGGSAALASLSSFGGTTILGNVAAGPTVPMTVGSITQNTLTIHNTGLLTVPMTSNRVTSTVASVSMDGNGTFDLGNSELVTNTAPAVIRGYLIHAYDPNGNADWGQPGLTSSFAKNNPTNYSVGYAYGGDTSAQDAGVRQHSGAFLGTNQTVVRPVLTGDANMDGTVDFFDITQILGYKYNTGQAASYTDGDLDYSGKVDFFDIVLLLSANYNTGVKFGPAGAGAVATLSGAGHAASPTGAVASATTIGAPGDGKPDFEYNPLTGDLRFRTDGGTFTTTGGSASFVSSLTITSASGALLSGGASAGFAGGTGATLTPTLLSSALTNSPGFTDGFDIGLVLAPGLDAATLTADLTVKYQSLNGGSLKTADITVPEPAGLALISIAAGAMSARRRRRSDCSIR
jgi:hypothetical protein